MFRFGLQPVLNFRKRREEEKQKELAAVNAEHRKIVAELLALSADREAKSTELNGLLARPTDVMTLRLYSNFLIWRDVDVELKKKELGESGGRMRKKQGELRECVRRKRMLEVLRERRLAAHVREERLRERILMDEIAANIWFKEGP
ncbi:MAG: flagellar export protein FliJ [Nitrospinae bacterium]|nr:flagellar export protein FliJ [Nitrospinota bacterium]